VQVVRWFYLAIAGAFSGSAPLGRLLLVPVALVCCAMAWPKIALRLHRGDKADKNELSRHCWGFTSPALRWDREGSFSHRAMDFLAEWTKLSGQRTAKAGSFVILTLAAIALAGWLR